MKEILIQSAVRHWHRLSTEAVGDPSVEVFRISLDVDLGNVVLVDGHCAYSSGVGSR